MIILKDVHDENQKAVVNALNELEKMKGAERLIPEVGLNMIYSKPSPKNPEDVVGLDGRVVVSRGKPRACGEVAYGGSTYLSSVLIEVSRLDPSKRAATVIKGGRAIAEALKKLGKTVVVLESENPGEGCPVAYYLSARGKVFDVYSHPGAFGIEPTTTLVSRDLDEILDSLRELLELV